LSILASFAEAVSKCLGGTHIYSRAEVQQAGVTHNSTSGNYTYDSVSLFGFEEPVFNATDCPPENFTLIIDNHRTRSLHARTDYASNIVWIEQIDNSLVLRFQVAQQRTIIAQVLSNTYEYSTNSSTFYIVLPEQALYTTNVVVIQTYIGNLEESVNALTITGTYDCVIYDCWFCNAFNWSCAPKLFKVFAVIILILLCLAILYCLYCAGLTFAVCASYGCTGIWIILRAGARGIYFQADKFRLWIEKNRGVVVATAVVGAAGVAQACDSSFSISSRSIVCTNFGRQEICNVTLSEQITMNGLGHTTCMNIYYDSEPLGSVKFTLSTYMTSCTLPNQYYTSSWKPYTASSFRCYGAGPCPCPPVITRDGNGEFDTVDDHLDYPGNTTCT